MNQEEFKTFEVGELDIGDTFITTGFFGEKNGIYKAWKKMKDQDGFSWCENVFSSEYGAGNSFKNDIKVIRVVFSLHRC